MGQKPNFQLGFSFSAGSSNPSGLSAPPPVLPSVYSSQPAPPPYPSTDSSHHGPSLQRAPRRPPPPTRFAQAQPEDCWQRAQKMVCFCFCCPLFKLAVWLCFIELLISMYCWYNIVGVILQTIHDFDFGNAFLIFILTFWIVTLCTAFGMLVAAQKRKNASYVLPRLIQQVGLLVCGLTFLFLWIFYFFGGAKKINSWVYWFYDFFLDEKLNQQQQKEVAAELKFYGLLCILLDLFFIGYVSVGLCITRKYHQDLERQHGSGFAPVPQREPNAPSAPPQQAVNPEFKA